MHAVAELLGPATTAPQSQATGRGRTPPMALHADAWSRHARGRSGSARCLDEGDDDKKSRGRAGIARLRSAWRRTVLTCKARKARALLPVKCDDRYRRLTAGLPWQVVVVAVLLSLALVAGTTVLGLETYGQLRFRGYFATEEGPSGLLGFYHEMDVDMDALAGAAGHPDARLFPTSAVSQRELKAWVAERRRKTNGHKFMIGCSGQELSAAPVFEAMKLYGEWEHLVTRNPTDFFFKQDRKKAPSALLFCLRPPQQGGSKAAFDLLLEHNKYFHELRVLGALILVWSDDLRHFNQLDAVVLRQQILRRADVLISPYAYAMDEFFAPVTAPMNSRDLPLVMWLPNAAGAEFTVASLNDQPINKILLPSSVDGNWPSPLGQWLADFQTAHPWMLDEAQSGSFHPEEYASYTRSYRATITTTPQFMYLLPELFEIAATGSLLVVNQDAAPLLASLGLHEREHFVGFDRAQPAPTLQWLADPEHRTQIDEIRLAGMQAMRKHHLSIHRQSALESFVTHGASTYAFPAGWQLPSPCPSAGVASDTVCRALYDRSARHQCDRWLCGFWSVLPRTWRRRWWPW